MPTQQELLARGYPPGATYQENVEVWAQAVCQEYQRNVDFCSGVESMGWLESSVTLLEVLGVQDIIDCVGGNAGACAWAAADLALTVVTAGIGKAASVELRLAKGALDGADDTGRLLIQCVRSNSFVVGTKVLLADGTSAPIEEVEAGDYVLAADPETGKTEPKIVTATIITEADKNYVNLTVVTEDGNQAIIATTHHPFWVESKQSWINAGDITPGMTLRTSNGEAVAVQETREYQGRERTYNLTVADLHTYYVLAGATPVLVHNSGPCGISARNERAGDIGNYTDSQKTRDPASQWYHEELSNEELLDGINNPGAGDGILVSRDGKILGGHHRKDELLARIRDGRIDPDTPIRIDVYDGE
ncbi:polymorphic toxin-type HINT domain-containing protein [Streptomyces zaomyceticus]|uniref:polymorphic toxin-type HINT domain-containing protein n=1 Tax=Streptomyces zaomyceticus TaxID=68286 RepID=UPI0037B7E646